MATSKQSPLQIISLFLLFFFSPSLSGLVTSFISSAIDPICKLTPYRDFCNTNLPHDKPGTIHDYGRIAVQKSLSEAENFLSLVEHYLELPSTSYLSSIRALDDCCLLAGRNIDFLLYVSKIISSTNSLHSFQADELQALLSAVLTNQQTCLDGLKETASASSILYAVLDHLSNGAKFYTVSLALVIHGWFSETKQGRWLTERKHAFSDMKIGTNGHLPLKISSRDREIFESVTGRKLLPATDDQYNVRVSQMVVVNPNGTADFTTINDAVAAAPNNTDISNGYFLIYVVPGIYEEYVSIPKYKKYLMMIGAGKGLTIITGNRSFVDGWTTFNSATFAVVGQGFVAVNITFQNTAGAIKHQAVAVRNGADFSTFYNCSFEGYQDTLIQCSFKTCKVQKRVEIFQDQGQTIIIREIFSINGVMISE